MSFSPAATPCFFPTSAWGISCAACGPNVIPHWPQVEAATAYRRGLGMDPDNCGLHASLEGLNIVGMKRRKFTKERLATVHSFYQKLFRRPGIFAERLAAVQELAAADPAIDEILTFIGNGAHRSLCLPADDN